MKRARCHWRVVWYLGLGLANADSAAWAQSLTNGELVGGAISTSGEEDAYSFSASAGENVQLRVADLTGSNLFAPVITLYDPSGAFVVAGQGQNVGRIETQAGATGTYTVVVADGSTPQNAVGSYNLYFVRAPGANEGGALSNGGVNPGRIDLGDLDSYTVTATAGEGIQLHVADLSANSSFFPVITLYDPSGAYVTAGAGQNVGRIELAARASGTYTVVVADGSTTGDGVGDYNFYFTQAPGANEGGALSNGGVNPGRIDLGDLDSYTVTATVGEGIQLHVADLSANSSFFPVITLYDPSGRFVTAGAGQNVGRIELTADATGTYTVVVADGSTTGDGVGDYNFYFTQAPGANEGGRLFNGSTRFDAIDLGDLDSYTFTASPGETAEVTVTDTSGGPFFPRVTLYGTGGAFTTFASGAGSATLSSPIKTAGIYTLVVADASTNSDLTGTYSIELNGAGGGQQAVFRRGDSNGDSKVDISDAVNTLTFLFSGGADVPCADAADADDDGILNVTDSIYTLGFLFTGANPEPPAPGPTSCGVDPSTDEFVLCEAGGC